MSTFWVIFFFWFWFCFLNKKKEKWSKKFFTPINIVTVVNRLKKHTGNRVSFMLLPKRKKNLVSFKCLAMTPERLAQTIQITLFRAIK